MCQSGGTEPPERSVKAALAAWSWMRGKRRQGDRSGRPGLGFSQ